MKRHCRNSLLLSMVLVARPSLALDVSSALTTSAVYSNNVRSTRTDKEDDVRERVGLDAALTETRPHLEANASIIVDHERYQANTYGSETFVRGGVGVLNLDVIESLLSWETAFNRDIVLSDATAGDNPENRGFRDVLRSGPTLNLTLSDTAALGLNARYVNVNNSDEDVSDSVRGEASARLDYDYNRITRLNLNTRIEKILEEDDLDKYTKRTVSVGLFRQFAGGTGSFDFGRTRLEPEFGDATDGNFFDVRFTHENVLGHLLVLSYSEDVSDATLGNFDSDSLQPEVATDGSNQLMTQKYATISASRHLGANHYELAFSQNRSFYEPAPGGQKAFVASARYTRALAEHWVLGAEFSLVERQNFDNINTSIDRTKVYTVDSHYDLNERLGVGSFVKFIDQDNAEERIKQYEEFQLGMDLRYQFF